MGCGRKPKEEAPLYDDGPTCPYDIKPSVLFALNENKDMAKLRELGGVAGIAKAIGTHQHTGLDPTAKAGSPASVDEHARVFGPNKYKEVPSKNFFALCFENLKDPIILLLIAAALVSTVLGSALPDQRKEGEWIEGIAIWVAVLIVVAVGAGNDYQKDLQFRKLNAVKDIIDIKVVRGGEVKIIPNTDIVVGDLMIVDTGDKIIADGVMVEGHSLVIDEASLTGESDPIKKNPEEDPWCRSGTQVSEGSGRVLVLAVGQQSEWGKTMALVGGAGSEDTPLQEKLADMAAAIGKVGFGVAVLSFIALIIKWFVTWCRSPEGCSSLKNHLNQGGLVEYFLYAVTIVVVAVPEGLPLAVTIALAYSMKKMMRDNNFVRVLAACETMGGATAICSDKTGTLTENRMTVTEGWFSGVKLDHAPSKEELSPEVLEALTLNCCLNSKAHLIDQGPDLVPQFVGNRTECALLMLARKWGVDHNKVREEWEPSVAEVYGFTSARKMASVLVRKDGKLRLYNKGAAEWVLQQCVSMHSADGQIVPMSDADRERLIEVVVQMASTGLRCICLTYTDYPVDDPSRPSDFFEDAANLDKNLIAVAIVGIKDPVRAEVPGAVVTCQKAGIRVRMVTGDNIHTARHIARECGILTEEGVALEGPAFRAMPEDELIKVLPKLQVLARSSPEDKLTLVAALKKQGEVVAVTGDGTNDAPALKESDVGLAMGIAGTEVAKEAADIVIMDDNFSSIVKSVLWGRSVFNSIRKFLQFQLTVNFVALVVAFVGAVAGGRIPLNVLQLLWVNLIMDTMGALALATEDPNPDLLNDKPYGREEPLITGKMWKHILVQGFYQLFWLFFFMYALPVLPWPRYWLTDTCTLISNGPILEPSPTYCIDRLSAPDAADGLGFSRPKAAAYCAALTSCNLPCGGPGARASAACAAAIAGVGGPSFAPGTVPGNEKEALCGLGSGGCPAYSEYRAVEQFWESRHEKQTEEEFKRADSLLFNAFIFSQIFNEINARRLNDELNVFEGLHRSPIFIGVLAITVGLQIIIMMTPMGRFFKVIPINGTEWGVSVAIGAFAVVVSVLTRAISQLLVRLGFEPQWRWGRARKGATAANGGANGAGQAELAKLEGGAAKGAASA